MMKVSACLPKGALATVVIKVSDLNAHLSDANSFEHLVQNN